MASWPRDMVQREEAALGLEGASKVCVVTAFHHVQEANTGRWGCESGIRGFRGMISPISIAVVVAAATYNWGGGQSNVLLAAK
jgi:hypothetical protein